MARARLLKPGFFTNEVLAELPFEGRLLFAGLWTLADREGRLEDRPKRIKAELFPWDQLEVDPLLDALEAKGFVVRYRVGDLGLLQVVRFLTHQHPHPHEAASRHPGYSSGPKTPSRDKVVPSRDKVLPRPAVPIAVPIAVSDPVAVPVRTAPQTARMTDELFAQFWEAYPKKKAKVEAFSAWNKRCPNADLLAVILRALAHQKASPDWRKESGRYVPYPATWLNRGQWTDEVTVDVPPEDRPVRPFTSQERADARKVRAGWFGRCQHEPTCADGGACEARIIREWRAKRGEVAFA